MIRDRRVQYETAGLDVDDVDPDPIVQWQRWHADAFEVGVAEPNAMTLGTVDADGTPDARIVLVRGADERGFAFYTNSRQRQEPPARSARRRVGGVQLARSAPPGPGARPRRAARRPPRATPTSRRASAPEPDRRVGVAAERGDRRPGRARPPRRRRRGALPGIGRAASTALGRVAAGPGGFRVLAGPPEPSPRSPPLPPRR